MCTSQPKHLKLLFSSFSIFLLALGINSCNNKSEKKDSINDSSAFSDSNTKRKDSSTVHILSDSDCITIPYDKVAEMIKNIPDWSDPSKSTYIKSLYFIPLNLGPTISVEVIPSDQNGSPNRSSIQWCDIKQAVDPPCGFIPDLIYHPCHYDEFVADLNDGTGKLKNFNFIRLIPQKYTDPAYSSYMSFNLEIVGLQTPFTIRELKPSPPALRDSYNDKKQKK